MGIALVVLLVLAPLVLIAVLAVIAPRWRWSLRLFVAFVLPIGAVASDYAFGILAVGPAAESYFVGEWQRGALQVPAKELGEPVCSSSPLWTIYPLEICSERQTSGAQYRLAYVPSLFWTVIGVPAYTGSKATLRPGEDGQMCLWREQSAPSNCQHV